MKITPFNYFKSIFGQSKDMIICVDSRLDVVYATPGTLSVFEKDQCPLINLGGIMAMGACDAVYSAMNETPHSVSFDFISTIESLPRKCVVIPTPYDNVVYYTLYLSNSAITAAQRIQIHDIEAVVDNSLRSLPEYIAPLTEISDKLSDSDKKIMHSSIAKIEKLFSGIEMVTIDKLYVDRKRTVNLHDYIKLLLEKISRRLDRFSFKYTLLPCRGNCITDISTDALDIMVVNLISEIFRIYDKSPHVYAVVYPDIEFNYIILTGSEHGLGYSPKDLLKQNNISNTAPLGDSVISSRAICAKIARDNDAKVFFTASFGGGVTHGIVLKKARNKQTVFYEGLEDYKNNYKLLDRLLADFD